MSTIVSATAFANNEIALIAWTLKVAIPDCMGFEVTRIYTDTGEERVLPAWVPFEGQKNPDWKPQTTSIWPIQKLYWSDLTVRKRRDQTTLRPSDVTVKYRIRPMVPAAPGLDPVPAANVPPKTYEGDPFPLCYFDEGRETNEVLITAKHGDIQSAFTNGILSAQWLKYALEANGEVLNKETLVAHMQKEGDPIREYLTGDVLGLLRQLVDRAEKEKGARVRLALYELTDPELESVLIKNAAKVDIILSNTGKGSGANAGWDGENSPIRKTLHKTPGMHITDRMFNNGRIGHNKFAIYVGADGKCKAVLTGSTNWTYTGLCGQSNNAMLVESPELARLYSAYWNRLLKDTKNFVKPKALAGGLTGPTSNAQGPDIRTVNSKPPTDVKLQDATLINLWCSPNTKATTKGADTPPDLAAVYSLMRKASKVILFAVFLPSRSGKSSIIEEAINIGANDHSVLVYGAISDPTAMPNYVAPPPKKPGEKATPSSKKIPSPAIYDKDNVHVVRAAAITKDDIVGQFEAEVLTVGQAIIHDKIVVVDPLSPDGFIAMGSHNVGFKASYENDENLLIIRNNPSLVRAYAVHVIDVYEHYRFRARRTEFVLRNKGKDIFDGFLSRDSKWLHDWMVTDKGALAEYLSSGP